MNQIAAYLALFTTLFLWSSAVVVIRYVVQHFHPGSMALLRLLAASVAISLGLFAAKKHPKLSWKDILTIVVLGTLINSVYQFCLALGEQTVTAGIGGFIISTIPLYSTIGAVLFLKEPMSKLGWLGAFVSFCGIVVIARGEAVHFDFDIGVVYIMISAIAASIYTVFSRPMLKKVGPVNLTIYLVWAGTLVLLPFWPKMMQDVQTAPLHSTLWLIYLGVFPTAVAHSTYNFALSRIPVTAAANWLYAIPIITCLQAWIFLNEIPTPMAALGGCIALCGTILVTFAMKRKKAQDIQA